ncbi:hypothetical protein [Pseudovibrio sp. Ad37]|uniref:hypothetical protein n=1 Tax=Pseudovibrio sp. Ad37 TaxID=989422 RepID=UPI0007B25534|nr:hypothetical protein [Pseudovibrio sp. Ad37]KZL24260.1 hypothetical protein PsAD37_02831 [Pseudovibrio sp. Ad37]
MTTLNPSITSSERSDSKPSLQNDFAAAAACASVQAIKSTSPDLEASVWVVGHDHDHGLDTPLFTKQEDFDAFLMKQLENYGHLPSDRIGDGKEFSDPVDMLCSLDMPWGPYDTLQWEEITLASGDLLFTKRTET